MIGPVRKRRWPWRRFREFGDNALGRTSGKKDQRQHDEGERREGDPPGHALLWARAAGPADLALFERGTGDVLEAVDERVLRGFARQRDVKHLGDV